jgi:hypothetical protein
MTDAQILQEFFDSIVVAGRLNSIVNVEEFLAGVHGLQDYGPKADSDPSNVLACIRRVHRGIGSELFAKFVSLDESHPGIGLDDWWARWCQCPIGVQLHQADYPAGAIPLWSNGNSTVYCRVTSDAGGAPVVDFGVTA